MALKIDTPATIHANPEPLLVSRQAAFPGLVVAPDGDLVAVFSIGQAFDAADMVPVVSRSPDAGRSWSAPEPMFPEQAGWPRWSETVKPVVLPDGRLLATGYGFHRPDLLTPIVDPNTRRVLPMRNTVSWSEDSGRTWTPPRAFSVGGAELELSGPAIVDHRGRLLAVAAPFHLGPSDHEGWLIVSEDGGATWARLSVFYRSEGGRIAPWECRLAELAPGRIAVLFWAYDCAADRNLENHVALSEDGGATFAPALSTSIQAQASNLVQVGDTLVSIHCHREAPVGLVIRRLVLGAEGVTVAEEQPVFSVETMASDSSNIAAQFGSLKFGQPSLLPLPDGTLLAAWWQVENCQHVIKSARVTLKPD